jgi:hypothetical protein
LAVPLQHSQDRESTIPLAKTSLHQADVAAIGATAGTRQEREEKHHYAEKHLHL